LAAVEATIFDSPHLHGVPTVKHLAYERIVIGRLITRMGLLERLPVLGKDLLKDTPVPCGCCKHRRPPSEEVQVVVMPWVYHGSPALSTPPQG
jgi:hypothetical protein